MAYLLRAGGMQGFATVMRSLGIDPQPLLAQRGFDEAMLADEDRLVPLQQAFDLVEHSAMASGRADLGLLLAQAQDIGMLGPLALAVRNAPTLGGAIALLTRYLCVQSPALASSLHPTSDSVPGTLELRYEPTAGGRVRAAPPVFDHGLAIAHSVLGLLSDGRHGPVAVSLPYPAPLSLLRIHERFYGAPVADRRPFAALHLAPSVLALPLRDARPALLRMASDYLARHAPRLDAALAGRVRLAIARSLTQGQIDKETVGMLLGLQPRTLQRRLAAEGTSFETLRDDVRRDATLRYLGDLSYSIGQVAALVGFTESSSFTRFCRQQLHGTPREIRARLNAQRPSTDPRPESL